LIRAERHKLQLGADNSTAAHRSSSFELCGFDVLIDSSL